MSIIERAQRWIALAFLALTFPVIATAQENMEDVVYLKNGSVIRGVIIEQVPNVSLKIQTADRNVFVFRIEEVEKITKEVKPGKSRQQKSDEEVRGFDNADIKQSGYSLIAELVMAVGYDDFAEKASFGVQVINGYQVNPNFNVGLGVGLNQHFAGTAYTPVFVDLRVNFLRKRVTPFVDLAGGWAFGLVPDKDEGGLYANPAFGVKFFVSPKTAMQLSLGFRYQETTLWDHYSNNYYGWNGKPPNLNAVNLKFGVTF